jgi:hypothetical protein
MQTGAVNVQFGISSTILIKSVTVKTPIGLVNFYIVKADTPFLLCLADMDRLQVYYNNVIDTLIGPITALGSKYITLPIIQQFRHPFLYRERLYRPTFRNLLTITRATLLVLEIHRLYRRFGHLLAEKLYRVLKRFRHDNVNRKAINHLTKYCSFC